MEDPITGHFPSRTQIDEEEERAAQEWSQDLDTPPHFEAGTWQISDAASAHLRLGLYHSVLVMQWSTAAQTCLRGGKLHTKLLVCC